MMLLSNRPAINYSMNAGQPNNGVSSVERIYIQKGPALPSLADQSHGS